MEKSTTQAESGGAIVELRQYTLHPGKREVLIELFEREFIESQEAVGMTPIGMFRNLADPDQFVWLREFRDMPTRAQALPAFYGGPVWKAHRETANATMIDSDNVLLLRPVHSAAGFSLGSRQRNPPGSQEIPGGLVVATIYYFDAPVEGNFLNFFEEALKPALIENGAAILAYLVTENSPNNYPALPVREGENVFIWFAGFRDKAAYEQHLDALANSQQWQDELSDVLNQYLKRPPEVLKLSPTVRSLII